MIGFLLKDDKSRQSSMVRAIKTIFFLIAMVVSLLVFSAPVLLAVADTVLPSALLSASFSPSCDPPPLTRTTAAPSRDGGGSGIKYGSSSSFFLSLIGSSLSSLLQNYDFRYSLIDIPLVSIARSVVILCVYSWCDGPRLSRGPYLWVATGCSVASLAFVSLKASFVFGGGYDYHDRNHGMEVALFCCSYALAVGHVAVAYRTSCRERKKLLVYRIDVEAVSACKNAFPTYQKKLLHEERRK